MEKKRLEKKSIFHGADKIDSAKGFKFVLLINDYFCINTYK